MSDTKLNNYILSLETSGSTCGIALTNSDELIAEYSVFGSNLHDKLLADFIKRLLHDLDVDVVDLDAVAISAGPGSFTGLRIGGSIAKALCLDEKPRLISVPTLQAIAFASFDFAKAVKADTIIAAVPSHKDLLYYQTYGNDINPVSEVVFCEKEEFLALDKEGIVFCGPGAKDIKKGYTLSGLNRLTPRFISNYANRLFVESQFTPAEEFVPLYVQEFQPKTKNK